MLAPTATIVPSFGHAPTRSDVAKLRVHGDDVRVGN